MSEQTLPYVTASAQCPEQLEVLGYVQDTCIADGDNDVRHRSQVGAYLAQGKDSRAYFWIDPFVYHDRILFSIQIHGEMHHEYGHMWFANHPGVCLVQLPYAYVRDHPDLPKDYGKQDVPQNDDIVMWYSTRLAEECEKLRQRVIRWEDR